MNGITDPTSPFFKDGDWGWDGTQWRKLQMLWGYSDVFAEIVTAENVAAASFTMTFALVPADCVYVVGQFTCRPLQASATNIQLRATIDGTLVVIRSVTSYTASDTIGMTGEITLKEGDRLSVRIINPALNDDFYAYASGYVMKIGA